MSEETNDPTQWPPPPTSIVCPSHEGAKSQKRRLVFGEPWADILFGILAGIVLFTLLTLTFFNSWAATAFPSQQKFPSNIRLLLGWFVAIVINVFLWQFLRKQQYVSLSKVLIWTVISIAPGYLFLIAFAFIMEYGHII